MQMGTMKARRVGAKGLTEIPFCDLLWLSFGMKKTQEAETVVMKNTPKHLLMILKFVFIFKLIYNRLTSALGPSTYIIINFIEFQPSILKVN